MAGNHFILNTSQEKLRILVIVVNDDSDSLFHFKLYPLSQLLLVLGCDYFRLSYSKFNLLLKNWAQRKTLEKTVSVARNFALAVKSSLHEKHANPISRISLFACSGKSGDIIRDQVPIILYVLFLRGCPRHQASQ